MTLQDSEAAWAALRAHRARLLTTRTIDLFDREQDRMARMALDAPHLHFDASKEPIDAAALQALFALAQATDALGFLRRAHAGEAVNITEKRAALHTALRGGAPSSEIARDVRDTQARLQDFVTRIVTGAARGATGETINAVVHLGIGGSDLGPRLVVDALHRERRPGFEARFAANIDGADIVDALDGLDPARTLVVAVSKTFTTQETLANANAARAWLAQSLGEAALPAHLAAVSAAPDKAVAWGVAPDHVFPFWDWVGGRYSLWSAVGVTAMLALRDGTMDRLRAGAAAMDQHVLTAPESANAPLLAALVQTWRRVICGWESYAMIPYARRLRLLPGFLQQLEMESNGKGVTADGAALDAAAAGVTWGDVGTNAQHSFFQLIHQGRTIVPVDFLIVAETEGPPSQRAGLLGNALAQAEALLLGKTAEAAEQELIAAGLTAQDAVSLAPHKAFSGNRPSSMLGITALTPESLGAVLAFYEHRTVLQAAIMGVNPFDQWGVELGKAMARIICDEITTNVLQPHDASTTAWIQRLRHRS
jgi:glucose-6-phosphate isomerase